VPDPATEADATIRRRLSGAIDISREEARQTVEQRYPLWGQIKRNIRLAVKAIACSTRLASQRELSLVDPYTLSCALFALIVPNQEFARKPARFGKLRMDESRPAR